jgi:3-hydroxyisobutyrate dehydrogenase-like beta-hydroxyacid dehydrogenase
MPEKVGFIGLGNIGHAMALKIQQGGYPMVVHDLRTERMEILTKEGAEAAASPKDVASEANTIFLSLTTSLVVEQVCLGPDGIAEGAKADTVVVDLTSGNPEISTRIANRLAEKGIHFLDAGVSGGASGSLKGTLGIMVGGDGAILERVRPILTQIGTNIFHMGPVGCGHMAKALNNTVSAVNYAIACETMLIGAKAGLDPQMLIAAFNASGGRSNATQSGIPNTFFSNEPEERGPGMDLYLQVNNVANACEIGRNLQTPMYISNLVHQIMLRIQDEMGPNASGGGAVGEALEQWLGVKVRVGP